MAATPARLDQHDIPDVVADLLLGFCLRRPDDRLLDPACGQGALLGRAVRWLSWLGAEPEGTEQKPVWGIELDTTAALLAGQDNRDAYVLNANFFALEPDDVSPFDALVSNPPYAHAGHVQSIPTPRFRQLPLFPQVEAAAQPAAFPLLPDHLAGMLGASRYALHTYYLLHGTAFLREGGRLGFILPSAWLDVAYATTMKQFLLDHYRILAIIESGVERWLGSARVNMCLLVMEKCAALRRRQDNLVRLVRLRRPLSHILPPGGEDHDRFLAVERLIAECMPVRTMAGENYAVQVVEQHSLQAHAKWGTVLRAPAFYVQQRQKGELVGLKEWATVERGYTTGANEFFYLGDATVQAWGVEARYRQPLLKSMREVGSLQVRAQDCRHEVLIIPADHDLRGTAVEAYIAWGEEQGYQRRPTCAARHPWYALSERMATHLVLPKGIWHRHLAPMLLEPLGVDQQLYHVRLAENVPILAAAALLNSAWFAVQIELQGRVGLGRGLLWLAAYELEEIRLPDPRRLSDANVCRLEGAVQPLLDRGLLDTSHELNEPDRQALDEVVFDLLGFGPSERSGVRDTLQKRLLTRRRLATPAHEMARGLED